MADRMPTDEEFQQYVQAILANQPGKTAAQRLNYLQDWGRAVGFDPFGTPYEREVFDEELYFPVTRQQYATDESSPYALVFDLVDQGADPQSAVRQALANGAFGGRLNQDEQDDVVQVAKDYSRELVDYNRAYRKWEQEQSKAAREAPVTFADILNPLSEYEMTSANLGMDRGYTPEDLMNRYLQRQIELRGVGRPAAQQPVVSAPAARADSRNVLQRANDIAGQILNPFRAAAGSGGGQRQAAQPAAQPARAAGGKSVGPVRKAPQLSRGEEDLFGSAARQLIEMQQNKPVWDERTKQVMRNIAQMNLLSQGAR